MDSGLINIQVSKIISAPKWKVVRCLAKVWELPAYVPTIKDVSVIHKTHRTFKTKWRVEINGVIISWLEEETFDFEKSAIIFKAIEGDLEEFRGEWKFQDDHEGTLVSVNVYLKVGIPGIEEFANEYVRNLLSKNFEEILAALEQRLISNKYRNFKSGNLVNMAGFGILGHFYNMNHLMRSLKMLKPDFKMPSEEFLSRLFSVTPSFKIYDMKEYKSKSGAVTHGCFIVCTFIPDMLYKNIHGVYAKVVRACKIAEKAGVGIVTLGGFTSIVGEQLGHQIAEDVDIPITTGNTYTAALAVDGVAKASQLLGRAMKDSRLVIVGGTGDIGSACARALCRKVKHITITGRTKANLRAIKTELKKKFRAKVEVTGNNEKAVRKADIVIAAASASSAILKMEWFKPGAVICDLGYPKNISYAPRTRKDLFVFSGGLASLPMPIDIGIDLGLPDPNVAYGCFSEVIILALERRFENYSYGRGNITLEKMDEIRELGKKHGFELAPFFWADGLIKEQDIEEIKKAYNPKFWGKK